MTDFVVRADEGEPDKSDKAKAIEDALKADAAKKKADAEAEENERKESMAKILDAVGGLTKTIDGLCGRMDALEAGGKTPGEPKEPAVQDSDDDKADPDAMADAQCKADEVANSFGQSAPKPLSGESLLGYRRRLLRPFVQYSAAFKDVDLAKLDPTVFAGVESKVYADALEASKAPAALEGRLIERSVTRNGHTFTSFHGDPRAWMNDYSGHQGQAVTGFGPTK